MLPPNAIAALVLTLPPLIPQVLQALPLEVVAATLKAKVLADAILVVTAPSSPTLAPVGMDSSLPPFTAQVMTKPRFSLPRSHLLLTRIHGLPIQGRALAVPIVPLSMQCLAPTWMRLFPTIYLLPTPLVLARTVRDSLMQPTVPLKAFALARWQIRRPWHSPALSVQVLVGEVALAHGALLVRHRWSLPRKQQWLPIREGRKQVQAPIPFVLAASLHRPAQKPIPLFMAPVVRQVLLMTLDMAHLPTWSLSVILQTKCTGVRVLEAARLA